MTDTMQDPFATPVNMDDPFATAEDTKAGSGGEFKPSPKPEFLDGALIAMVPRKHDKQARKLEKFVRDGDDPYQERWTVDLYVIETPGNVDLTFYYTKIDKETKAISEGEYTIRAGNLPEAFPHSRVYQWAINGQLNKVADGPRPILMGRMGRAPKAADERAGKTFADVAAEFEKWESRGKRGERPGFAWKVNQDVSAEDREKALAWYRSEKPDLTQPIERTTEPTN